MKFVVGLGNPGRKYEGTRHNAGFLLLDYLVGKVRVSSQAVGNYSLRSESFAWKESKKGQLQYMWLNFGGEKVELVKPLTMMNNSGKAVTYIKKKHPGLKFRELFVVHDDLDIELGSYKIQLGKGPRQHGGLGSIYRSLGSRDFWHVRVGINNRVQSASRTSRGKIRSISGEEYVLQGFTSEERQVLEKVLDQVAKEMMGKIGKD